MWISYYKGELGVILVLSWPRSSIHSLFLYKPLLSNTCVGLTRHAPRRNVGSIVHTARGASTKQDGDMAELHRATSLDLIIGSLTVDCVRVIRRSDSQMPPE